jgi:hypothetical protein
MINRSIMKRQMFKAGGAAFPDLSGDGKVTQKDILMGRGVQFRQDGGPAMPMKREELYGLTPQQQSQQSRLRDSIIDRNMIPEGIRNIGRMLGLDIESPEGYRRAKEIEDRLRYERELMQSDPGMRAQKRMQEGGMVEPMMDPAMMQAPMDPAMMDPAMMQAPMDPAMMQAPMDPAQNEMMGGIAPLLEQVAQVTDDLDTARNYEELINMLRGDQMPIGARYEELASLVGPDDAVQTPESVLALTQPTIMMTMGAGIGGLAQEAMDVPVEGDMAGGIMQMAAPPPQLPPPPMDPMMDPGMEAGGTPPVNFNQGGLVRRGDNQPVQKFSNGGTPTVSSFEPGGVVEMAGLNQVFSPQDLQNMSYGYKLGQQATLDAAPDLMSEFEGRSDLYREILGSDEQTQAANKGQFLFDLAKFGLALANEPGGRSPGEIIARAATGSKLVENIQARSAAEKARKEKLDLAALTQAEAAVTAKTKAIQEREKARTVAEQEAISRQAEERQKQLGRIELANLESVNRQSLEIMQNQNALELQKLKGLQGQDDINLRNRLEAENMTLQANIDLNKLGVKNQYELAKMDKAHEQATELNNTNNALKETLAADENELSRRRLELDAIKAAINSAQGQQKIELQKEAQKMEAENNAFEREYKNKKLVIEQVATNLTRLGSSTDARIMTLISDPDALGRYASGTMTPEQTLEFNQAIAYFNNPKTVWDEKNKNYKQVPGNPLSIELESAIRARKTSGFTVPNITLGQANKTGSESATPNQNDNLYSEILNNIDDPNIAFGTPAKLAAFTNVLAEMVTLDAPFKATKDAITATETLNTRLVQEFQQNAELRDSVRQLELLLALVPDPASFFTGPQDAASKVRAIVGMIDDVIKGTQVSLDDPGSPLDAKQTSTLKGNLYSLKQLRGGYLAYLDAYGRTSMSATDKAGAQALADLQNKMRESVNQQRNQQDGAN